MSKVIAADDATKRAAAAEVIDILVRALAESEDRLVISYQGTPSRWEEWRHDRARARFQRDSQANAKTIQRATKALKQIGPLAIRGFNQYRQMQLQAAASGHGPAMPDNVDVVVSGLAAAFAAIGSEAVPALTQIVREQTAEGGDLNSTIWTLDSGEREPTLKAFARILAEQGRQPGDGDDPIVLRVAHGSLAQIGGPAVATLIQVLDRNSLPAATRGLVRLEAMLIIAEIGPPASEAVPAVVRAMKDDKLREAAAWTLAKMGSRGISLLARALKSRSPEVQASAAKAIQELDSPQSLPGLAGTKADRTAVTEALRALKSYRQQQEADRMRQRTADADHLREVLLRCAAGEGGMKMRALVAEHHVRRTLSDPPKEMIDNYEAAANDAGKWCEGFTAAYANYMHDYHEDVSFWNRCDSQISPARCAEMRRWLHTHR